MTDTVPKDQRRGRAIAMAADERDQFLASERTCRLATVGGDGAPHVTPLWYVWDGESMWVNSLVRSQRWADVQRDSRVSVVVDAGDEFLDLRGVELNGIASPVGEAPRTGEPAPELEIPERLFADKYAGGRVHHDGRHAWLRIAPSKIQSWDFRKMQSPAHPRRSRRIKDPTMTSTADALLRPLRLRDRHRPLPDLEASARRTPALLQRPLRLLRGESLRGHRPVLDRLADLQLGQGNGPRAHPQRRRGPARLGALRRPAAARPPPGAAVRVFTPRKVNAIEPKLREFCARSLDPFIGATGFDFMADLGSQLPMRTIGMLLGIPEADQEAIRDRIDDGLRLADGSMPDLEARFGGDETPGSEFEAYLDWRAEHPSDDLMSELLYSEFEDDTGTVRRLSRAEVLGYVNLLAAAGNETTARLIGWTGKVLADHPDQREALVEDPGLIPNAINEILRYESPSPIQARYVTRDVELHGDIVPAGSVLLLLTASGNRDERRFPDSDRFDVRRTIDRHLAFGYGIHFCLGAALARLEARVALEEVLERFPSWEVDEANAVRTRTSTVRGWDRLPVTTTA